MLFLLPPLLLKIAEFKYSLMQLATLINLINVYKEGYGKDNVLLKRK